MENAPSNYVYKKNFDGIEVSAWGDWMPREDEMIRVVKFEARDDTHACMHFVPVDTIEAVIDTIDGMSDYDSFCEWQAGVVAEELRNEVRVRTDANAVHE